MKNRKLKGIVILLISIIPFLLVNNLIFEGVGIALLNLGPHHILFAISWASSFISILLFGRMGLDLIFGELK